MNLLKRRERIRRNVYAYRQRLLEKGLCRDCGKEQRRAGHTQCGSCLAVQARAASRRYYAKMNKLHRPGLMVDRMMQLAEAAERYRAKGEL